MAKFLPYKVTTIEDLPNEVWQDIPMFEGSYQASNLGRVKSLEFDVYDSNGLLSQTVPSLIVPQYKDKDGYLKIEIGYRRSAHRLIAAAFLRNFYSMPVVNHINGNRDENWISNLEMCTHKGNSIHRYARQKNNGIGIPISNILHKKKQSDFLLKKLKFRAYRTSYYLFAIPSIFAMYHLSQFVGRGGLLDTICYAFFMLTYDFCVNSHYQITLDESNALTIEQPNS